MDCTECKYCNQHPQCPGPDSDKCPLYKELKDDNEGFTEKEREKTFMSYDDTRYYGGEYRNIPPSRDEQILNLYFKKRKTQVEVAKILSISQSCVSKVVSKHRPVIVSALKEAAKST